MFCIHFLHLFLYKTGQEPLIHKKMKTLLLIIIILIGCSVVSCSNSEDEYILDNAPKTKSLRDSTSNDSTNLGIHVVVNGWDTINSQVSF
jgi:hypothetical protein